MSHHRRLSGYTLFPTCTPLSVSEDSKEPSLPLQVAEHNGNPTPPGRSAAIPYPEGPANSGRLTNNPIVLVNRKLRQKMGRLIPLKLGSPSVTRSPSPPLPSKDNVVQPMKSTKPRPGPVTELIILPYTEKDWRSVMNEVKDLYLKGQYKHCSVRCKQILDSIKDSYLVHPLYLIYLSFFAASSLEMTASSLHNNCSTKLPLYQEALAFYQKAASHLEFASFSANPAFIHVNNSSIPSSARSSVDSIFSQASARSISSSVVSSPPLDQPRGRGRKRSTSPSNFTDDEMTPEPLRTSKKKVSFSPSTLPSPMGPPRPGSRGKGLQLMTPTPTTDEATLLDAFPVPPSQTTSSEPSTSEPNPEPEPEPELESNEDYYPQQDSLALTQSSTTHHLALYIHHLSALSTQLSYHTTSIHTQISTLSASRKSRRNGLDFAPSVRRMSMEGVSREEVKRTELQERIQRLKEQGWERRRFDAERYQRLAERALEEVREARV